MIAQLFINGKPQRKLFKDCDITKAFNKYARSQGYLNPKPNARGFKAWANINGDVMEIRPI